MSHFFAPPWWGKILGFLFGLMFGRLPGALIGLWLGHRFDRGLSQQWQARGGFQGMFGADRSSPQSLVFFHVTFAVMGHVAKATGRVSESEITYATRLMQQMKLDPEARQRAQEAFREGKLAGFPLEQELRRLRQSVAERRDMLQFFLEVQLQVAFADGQVQPEELEVLHVIAAELGFSSWDLNRLLTMMEALLRQGQRYRQYQQGAQQGSHQGAYQGAGRQPPPGPSTMSFDDACEILGISAGASPVEIKRAYRRQMAQHHPDKLEARGLPPEMKQIAKEKSQQIQQAYQVIKTRRGFR